MDHVLVCPMSGDSFICEGSDLRWLSVTGHQDSEVSALTGVRAYTDFLTRAEKLAVSLQSRAYVQGSEVSHPALIITSILRASAAQDNHRHPPRASRQTKVTTEKELTVSSLVTSSITENWHTKPKTSRSWFHKKNLPILQWFTSVLLTYKQKCDLCKKQRYSFNQLLPIQPPKLLYFNKTFYQLSTQPLFRGCCYFPIYNHTDCIKTVIKLISILGEQGKQKMQFFFFLKFKQTTEKLEKHMIFHFLQNSDIL